MGRVADPPLSTSAWVTVYVAVHVVESLGARVVVPQSIGVSGGPAGASNVSSMARAVIVTLPVLVTVKV